MTLDGVLTRLTQVRRSGKGWMARCPAHEDRNPSLSIREGDDGTILLHCFAGCAFDDIARALNLSPRKRRGKPRPPPKTKRKIRWDLVPNTIQLRADGLWLRAQKVFEAVNGKDITHCSPEELESMLERVYRAYEDLKHADYLEDVAFDLRWRHVTKKTIHKGGFAHEPKPILN